MGARTRMPVLALGFCFAFGGLMAAELFAPSDRIANEGKIGDMWMLADGVALATPVYPASFAARGGDVCIGLGYRIGDDGSTSNFAVLRQWNSESGDAEPVEGFWKAFAEAGADAVGQWRFQPKPGQRARATYTVATLAFTGKAGTDAAVGAHCRIADLAAVIQERQGRASRKSRETHDLERARQAAQGLRRMDENPGLKR